MLFAHLKDGETSESFYFQQLLINKNVILFFF